MRWCYGDPNGAAQRVVPLLLLQLSRHPMHEVGGSQNGRCISTVRSGSDVQGAADGLAYPTVSRSLPPTGAFGFLAAMSTWCEPLKTPRAAQPAAYTSSSCRREYRSLGLGGKVNSQWFSMHLGLQAQDDCT
eukprot:5749254-Pleurochrysis_carterae.AAC.15